MLRRRIFSSAMASVMALSAVAVVAQAEETTNQVVTEEQLKELVEVTFGADYRADELDNYGKNSADAMLDALEAAEAILADNDADEEDYTVAYQMVMACEKRLTQHSLEELKALLDDAQAELDTNNIYNPELMDQIYNPEKFGALELAVGNAQSYLSSTSPSDIADAYDDLQNAYNDLMANALPKVSKSQFRNILKDYEAILADEFEYDMWRRGNAASWYGISNGNDWNFTGGKSTAAYGVFYDYCMEKQAEIKEAYRMIDEIKGLTITTDGDIVEGYTLASDLVKVFKGWTADSSSKATKAGVKALLDEYHGQLVYEFNATSVAELADAIAGGEIVKKYTMKNNLLKSKTTVYSEVTEDFEGYAVTGYNGDGLAKFSYIEEPTIVTEYNTDIAWATVIKGGKGYEADTYFSKTDYAVGDTFTETDDDGVVTTYTVKAKQTNDGKDEISYAVTSVVTVAADIPDTWNIERAKVKGFQDAEYWRLVKAEFKIKPTNTNLYIPLDEDGFWNPAKPIETDKADCDKNIDYQTIAKKSTFDLSKLIPVDSTMIVDGVDGDGEPVVGEFDLTNNTTVDSMPETNVWGNSAVYKNEGDKEYYIQLADAMAIAEAYLAGKPEDEAALIDAIDHTGVVAPGAKPNAKAAKEWMLVYRALEYALTDRYDGVPQGEAYTRADVLDLIDKAYDLVEETGDASIFNVSNVALVTARQEAISWEATTRKDRLYKDYNEKTLAKDGIEYDSSTDAYKALWKEYEQLEKEYNALRYSFGDVCKLLADTAARIDAGELAATDELLAAMDECAYRLSVMGDITVTTAGDYEDNYAFDVDRVMNLNNRVVTKIDCDLTNNGVEIETISKDLGNTAKVAACGDHRNTDHFNLLNAYNALNEAIAAQAEPDVVLGDANGDGAVTAADAAAILKSAVGLAEVDAAAADYNGDGAVTAADASAILKALVS